MRILKPDLIWEYSDGTYAVQTSTTGSLPQQPSAQSSSSRLLDGRSALAVNRCFTDLPELSIPGDLLVFNDTKVVKARRLQIQRWQAKRLYLSAVVHIKNDFYER